jgi:hypothetical protein
MIKTFIKLKDAQEKLENYLSLYCPLNIYY